jgi:Holliday junction resolvasome RuvABC endonuclease subunit
MEDVFIGIDASLTGTGMIALKTDGEILEQRKYNSFHRDKNKEPIPIEDRIISITNEVIDFVQGNQGNHINLEGVYIGRKTQKILQLGGLHYYLRVTLLESGFPLEITPPGQLKKYVTKKGDCKKELMLLKTFRRWGVEFTDNDLCDAYGLARMIMEKNKKPVSIGTIKRVARKLPSVS